MGLSDLRRRVPERFQLADDRRSRRFEADRPVNEQGKSGTLNVETFYRANRVVLGANLALLGLLTILAPLFVWRAAVGSQPGLVLFTLCWFLGLAFVWHQQLTRLVIRIEFDAQGGCRFFAATRLVAAFPAHEISGVSRNPRGLIVVRYPGGSLWALRPDGLDAFATTVIGANASAIIKL